MKLMNFGDFRRIFGLWDRGSDFGGTGRKNLRLMTNNPRKIAGLEGYGLKVTERVPLEINPCETNKFYLLTKKTKLDHLLSLDN